METEKELAGTEGQTHRQSNDNPLVVRFRATDNSFGQEVDLVMAALDELIAEMQRMGGEIPLEAAPSLCCHQSLGGEKIC